MTRLRIWLARWILGRHGVVATNPELGLIRWPKKVSINGTYYPIIENNTFAGSSWTNSPE